MNAQSRVRVVAYGLSACIASFLLGLYSLLEFDSAWPALLIAALVPAIALRLTCSVGWLFVAKIVIFSVAGWVFGYNSIPNRTKSLQGIAESWHGENERFIAAATICTIACVTTSLFARLSENTERPDEEK